MTATPVTASASKLGDTFAVGVLVMLCVNVLQRCVGLLRGLGFAHYLEDVQLGQWALANSFFIIAVPIACLGIPGSFGKFVAYFQARNQLAPYVARAARVTVIGGLLLCGLLLIVPDHFSWLVFGQPLAPHVLWWCVLALASAIALSFVNELVGGLRQVRTISLIQFSQSFTFAVVGVTWVMVSRDWWVLLPSFAIANCVAMLPGCHRLWVSHAEELKPRTVSELPVIWRRVLPFAASLWLMNLMSNLFEVGDRYMLLHFMGDSGELGQAAVGQYHCARILPNLLISVGLMLGGVTLPFLSADWEAQRFDQIRARVRQMLQCVSIAFLGLSIAAISVAPLMFGWFFGGRYAMAELVLPLALAQATWVALYLIAEPFLLCAERGKQVVLTLACGLGVNLLLNSVLIPSYGMYGAVVATSLASILVLGLLFWRLSAHGCPLGFGTWFLSVAPVCLLAGPIAAMLVFVALVFMAGRTNYFLGPEDRRQVDAIVLPKLERFGIRLESVWP